MKIYQFKQITLVCLDFLINIVILKNKIYIFTNFQIDVYKRQISDLHSKLEAENNRADKSEFETKRLLEKAEALSVERDRLQAERDMLKESNAELQDQVIVIGYFQLYGIITPELVKGHFITLKMTLKFFYFNRSNWAALQVLLVLGAQLIQNRILVYLK